MNILKFLKEVITLESKSNQSEQETFMELMKWGCYHDVNKFN